MADRDPRRDPAAGDVLFATGRAPVRAVLRLAGDHVKWCKPGKPTPYWFCTLDYWRRWAAGAQVVRRG